ncbi:MAG: hypothetical protein J7480_07125 [Microbacteriaceae bacterium]|nr:hypothetical protein [Microbacteriaceae bacterium]
MPGPGGARRAVGVLAACCAAVALVACTGPAGPLPGRNALPDAAGEPTASAPATPGASAEPVPLSETLPGWSYADDEQLRVRDLDPLPAEWWDPGLIVSDENFFDADAMSVEEIQAFLEEQVPYCATWHQRTDRETDSGWPYRCLKDRVWDVPHLDERGEDGERYCQPITARAGATSAEVISIVAHACGVSPRTLLVTLEKEQSLVTDRWPWDGQFFAATGYACYDSAPCVDAYGGFVGQVYHAARTYRLYVQHPTRFNYQPFAVNDILFAPGEGCASAPVLIRNRATAALYDYTPYQPNPSVLAGREDGDCSAYGNYNFWRLWFHWFGDPAGLGRTWPTGP